MTNVRPRAWGILARLGECVGTWVLAAAAVALAVTHVALTVMFFVAIQGVS